MILPSAPDAATQHELNEISDALAHLIEATGLEDAAPDARVPRRDVLELTAAVGLEKRERSKNIR